MKIYLTSPEELKSYFKFLEPFLHLENHSQLNIQQDNENRTYFELSDDEIARIRTQIRDQSPQNLPTSRFVIKSLRVDRNYYFNRFVEMITPPNKKYPLRKGDKKEFTVLGNGVFNRKDKLPQYTKEQKAGFSKTQSTSLGLIDYYPKVFGFRTRGEKLVGFMTDEDNVLYSNRLSVYDGGTVSRPYDFSNEEDANKYYEKKARRLLFPVNKLPEFEEAIKATDNYNEVLARLKWSTDGKSKFFIASDTLEARIWALQFAKIMKNHLLEKGLCEPSYTIEIYYYTKDNNSLNFKAYTESEQFLDYLESKTIYFDESLREQAYKDQDFEFLLMLADKDLIDFFNDIENTEQIYNILKSSPHIFYLLLNRAYSKLRDDFLPQLFLSPSRASDFFALSITNENELFIKIASPYIQTMDIVIEIKKLLKTGYDEKLACHLFKSVNLERRFLYDKMLTFINMVCLGDGDFLIFVLQQKPYLISPLFAKDTLLFLTSDNQGKVCEFLKNHQLPDGSSLLEHLALLAARVSKFSSILEFIKIGIDANKPISLNNIYYSGVVRRDFESIKKKSGKVHFSILDIALEYGDIDFIAKLLKVQNIQYDSTEVSNYFYNIITTSIKYKGNRNSFPIKTYEAVWPFLTQEHIEKLLTLFLTIDIELSFFEMILAHKEFDINAKCNLGKKLLFDAIRLDKPKLINLLVQNKDIDVNAKNDLEETPLCSAIYLKNIGAISILIKHKNIKLSYEQIINQVMPFFSEPSAKAKFKNTLVTLIRNQLERYIEERDDKEDFTSNYKLLSQFFAFNKTEKINGAVALMNICNCIIKADHKTFEVQIPASAKEGTLKKWYDLLISVAAVPKQNHKAVLR